jgi:hypothetical protein
MNPKIPSARRGITLLDTIKKAGFSGFGEFENFLAQRGMPMIGKTGGEKSLELLNSMVEPRDQYVKFYPEYTKMEEATLKTTKPKVKKAEGPRLAQKLIEIATDANALYGDKMSAKKRSFIKDAIKRARILIDDAAKLGFKALLPMAGPIGGALAFALEIATAPSAEAAEINPTFEEEMMERIKETDFSGPSASSMMLEKMKQDAVMKAGGGIMSINEMIKPIGK